MKRNLLSYSSIVIITGICCVLFIKFKVISKENDFLERYIEAMQNNYESLGNKFNSNNILLTKGSKEKINFDISINDLFFADHSIKDIIVDTTLILFFGSEQCSSCIKEELIFLNEKMQNYSGHVKILANRNLQKVCELVQRTYDMSFQFYFYNSVDLKSSLVQLSDPAYFVISSDRQISLPYISRKEFHNFTEEYFNVILDYFDEK